MEILNALIGPIGSYRVGPKQFLDRDIKYGEIAICVDREIISVNKPFIWLISGIEQAYDFLFVAQEKLTMSNEQASTLLAKLDEAKKLPLASPYDRLSNFLNMDITDLQEMLRLTQISISSPIAGVKNYKDHKVTWSAELEKQLRLTK